VTALTSVCVFEVVEESDAAKIIIILVLEAVKVPLVEVYVEEEGTVENTVVSVVPS
jgi:Tfp pilus assembly major pilin PilA